MIIKLGNSYSTVEDMTTTQYAQLRDLLSYTEGDVFSRFGPVKKYLIDKRGVFPSGLLSRIKKAFPDVKIVDTRIVPQARPGMFRMKV
jgi:hypothetical protein